MFTAVARRGGAVTQRATSAYADRVAPDRLPTADTPANLVSLRRGSLEVASRYEFRSTEDLPSSPIFVPRGSTTTRWRHCRPSSHAPSVPCRRTRPSACRLRHRTVDVDRHRVALAPVLLDRLQQVLLHTFEIVCPVEAPTTAQPRYQVVPTDE